MTNQIPDKIETLAEFRIKTMCVDELVEFAFMHLAKSYELNNDSFVHDWQEYQEYLNANKHN